MMKRKKEQEPEEQETKGKIERKIVIGLVTNTEYTREVLKCCDPTKFLEAQTAKLLAGWCVEYFRKYDRSPNRDIEGIYFEKLREGLATETGDEIEKDILPSLNEEYEQEVINEYLVDQTIKYFQHRQAEILHTQQGDALEGTHETEEYYKLQIGFEPIHRDISDDGLLNITNLYTQEMKPVEWLIKDLIPKGMTIFGGKSKTGKSYLITNIVSALAQRRWMFEEDSATAYHGPQGEILYLALEDSERRIQKRLRDIDPDPDLAALKRYLQIRIKWPMLYPSGIIAIREWAAAQKNPVLVVIDVIAKVWNKSAKTSGGGLYAEEYSMFGPLADLARDCNMSVIVVTHTTKSKESDVFDEILGGAGTAGPADSLMVLSKVTGVGNKKKRMLAIRGKDIDDTHLQFIVEQEGAQWTCEGESDEVRMTEERESVYNYLNLKGATSYMDIQQAAKDGSIEVSPRSINTILRKMVGDGTLEQTKKYGPYDISSTKRADQGIAKRMKRTK